MAWAEGGGGMTSMMDWKVAVERGSHCCMIRLRRLRVSLDRRSRGVMRMLRAVTIFWTASGLLASVLGYVGLGHKTARTYYSLRTVS